MFFDIGPFELVTIVLLGVIVFGPDKLPKLIQDLSAMIRKLREFSDSAKADLRKELGPEFKDFDFEDLNPRTFVRKNLLDDDAFGLRDLRNSFDLKDEITAVSEAVRESSSTVRGAGDRTPLVNGSGRLRKHLAADSPAAPDENPPFDVDAT